MLFTADLIEEPLLRAGFETVHHLARGRTASRYGGIVELDDREPESLFFEATVPAADG